jgi:hypothetical protein
MKPLLSKSATNGPGGRIFPVILAALHRQKYEAFNPVCLCGFEKNKYED